MVVDRCQGRPLANISADVGVSCQHLNSLSGRCAISFKCQIDSMPVILPLPNSAAWGTPGYKLMRKSKSLEKEMDHLARRARRLSLLKDAERSASLDSAMASVTSSWLSDAAEAVEVTAESGDAGHLAEGPVTWPQPRRGSTAGEDASSTPCRHDEVVVSFDKMRREGALGIYFVREKGATVISKVAPGSIAAENGAVAEGMVLRAVNAKPTGEGVPYKVTFSAWRALPVLILMAGCMGSCMRDAYNKVTFLSQAAMAIFGGAWRRDGRVTLTLGPPDRTANGRSERPVARSSRPSSTSSRRGAVASSGAAEADAAAALARLQASARKQLQAFGADAPTDDAGAPGAGGKSRALFHADYFSAGHRARSLSAITEVDTELTPRSAPATASQHPPELVLELVEPELEAPHAAVARTRGYALSPMSTSPGRPEFPRCADAGGRAGETAKAGGRGLCSASGSTSAVFTLDEPAGQKYVNPLLSTAQKEDAIRHL
jgi:hypothetical protein